MFGKAPHPETCPRCPNRFSERGCPCWVKGVVETDGQGNERVSDGCFYELMPRWFVHVIRASNRPAAAVESMRNELCARVDEQAERQKEALLRLSQIHPALIGGHALLEAPHAKE